MSRPSDLKKKPVLFTLSREARETLRKEARRRGLSMSSTLEQLIRFLPKLNTSAEDSR